MDAPGSGSDASDEQWDSPAEHGETSSSEECSSEEDEPCSDEEAEKVAALRYLHAPSVSEVFKKKPGRKRGVKLEPCATATDTEVACARPQRERKATKQFVAAAAECHKRSHQPDPPTCPPASLPHSLHRRAQSDVPRSDSDEPAPRASSSRCDEPLHRLLFRASFFSSRFAALRLDYTLTLTNCFAAANRRRRLASAPARRSRPSNS